MLAYWLIIVKQNYTKKSKETTCHDCRKWSPAAQATIHTANASNCPLKEALKRGLHSYQLSSIPLFDLGFGAVFNQLGPDRLGLFLVYLFFDRLRGSVDQVLGLLEAEAGDLPHHLDDVDLLVADLC